MTAGIDRVEENELCSFESRAGGAGPSPGPEVNRVEENELCSFESRAGGAGPSQGPEVNR
jgi:hypothetical protein